MTNLDKTFAQHTMDNDHDLSESEDKHQVHVPHTITTRPVNS